jgi:hypothetical protein
MTRSIRWSAAAFGIVFMAAVALATTKLKDGDVDLISEWFSGTYDTGAPADGSPADGHVLMVERVSSPMISWHVFYVEERNALKQAIAVQLIAFDLPKDKKSIVARSFSFKDPRRWETGLEQPDIFKQIISDDLIPATGCEIYWLRAKDGYVGKSAAGTCRLRSRATGLSMNVSIVAKLTPSVYTYGDRTFHKRAAGLQ